MVIEEENVERIRVGIGQADLAHYLKRARCDLVRVGREAVGDFQAVLVRLVLEVTAEGGADRRYDERKNREQQQQHG